MTGRHSIQHRFAYADQTDGVVTITLLAGECYLHRYICTEFSFMHQLLRFDILNPKHHTTQGA